ncbi:MAG: hypothetical protein IJJ13_05170 [Lachnospiraceae bacterium]|nr:hypothetical protein [Lachnospiraceae bacterium]
MEHDFTWLSRIGINTEDGIAYTGGKEKYLSALQRFYKGYEKNRAKVEDFFRSKDDENYMITVHALKSNAKMIGASELSAQFERLESAARDGDSDVIAAQTEPTLKAYEDLVKQLSPIGEMEKITAAGEISAEEARETARLLLAALDDFDDEASLSLVKKLSGYPFRLTQKELLKKAEGLIGDFLYDDAAAVIQEISGAIE